MLASLDSIGIMRGEAMDIRVKRAYEPAAPEDGARILVDRLWPRGLRKPEVLFDRWEKDLAPSSELRRWFAHDPRRWDDFRRRYAIELSKQSVLLDELRVLARRGRITLVYSARDEAHNQAVVLRDILLRG